MFKWGAFVKYCFVEMYDEERTKIRIQISLKDI